MTAEEFRHDRRRSVGESPDRRGSRGRLRISGRRGPSHLRFALQAEPAPPHPGASRAGGGPCCRGLCPLDRQGRRRAGDVGPRRHQRRDRSHRRPHGFHPDRLPDRPGADPPDRQRRLPGGRHDRHHPALHQAQLPGEGRDEAAAHGLRGLLRRPFGPSGSRGHRPAQGHPDGQGALCGAAEAGPAPQLPAAGQGRRAENRAGGGDDRQCQAADLLHRRRRDQFRARGLEAAGRAGAPDRLSHHQHADGARRLPGVGQAVPRHAGHARHLRSQSRDVQLRCDDQHRRALRRPHHRQAARNSRRAPGRSISISIRRRSTRASASTCRSSATWPTCSATCSPSGRSASPGSTTRR